MNELDFATEWMGGYDWRFGVVDPSDGQLKQQSTLHRRPEYYAELITRGEMGIYLTINPMANLNEVSMIQKIGWDFDSKKGLRVALDNAQLLRLTIRERWNAESLLVFTGGRGYHVYAWLNTPYTNPNPERVVAVYGQLFDMSIHGLRLETFDPGLSYPKHQIRAPFTVHQKTKDICRPVKVVNDSPENMPLEAGFTECYRSHGVSQDVIKRAEMILDNPHPASRPSLTTHKEVKNKRLRPCLSRIMQDGVMNDDGWLRTMAVFEAKSQGLTWEAAAELFENIEGYNPSKTQDHLNWIFKHEKDYIVKCDTIAKRGYCMGEWCRLYRWMRAHGAAPELNPAWNRWDTPPQFQGGASP